MKSKTKKNEEKHKRERGRPIEYYPGLCEEVVPLLEKGMSIEELGLDLKVGYSTIYTWMEKYPDFLEAIKKGRELSKGWWMKRGRRDLCNKDFNSTLWYMNMRNRFGWGNKQDHENNATKHEDALKELE